MSVRDRLSDNDSEKADQPGTITVSILVEEITRLGSFLGRPVIHWRTLKDK